MKCICRGDIEARLLERFKGDSPEATSHEVVIKGYAFILQGNELESLPVIPVEMTACFPLKKGGTKRRVVKTNMTANFCPFCGTVLRPVPATPSNKAL